MPSAPPFQPSANGHHIPSHQSAVNSLTGLTNGQAGLNPSNAISPHHHHSGPGGIVSGGTSQTLTNEDVGIREVWASNLEDEFKIIRLVVQHYPYIAMDTEFPGVVCRPIGQFVSNTDYVYQIMRCNIQLLKIIQLGLTFMDANGKTPSGVSTWQFNFKFNLNEDMYAQESIDLLTNSGIQFKKHEEEGIDTTEFAVLLIGSGVVLCDNIYWLSFHSGYDFGYLLRLLTGQQLPKKVSEFFELLKIFFPRVYDLKYLMKSTKDLKGGLQEVNNLFSSFFKISTPFVCFIGC